MKDNIDKIWHKHDGEGFPVWLMNDTFEVKLFNGTILQNHRERDAWEWFDNKNRGSFNPHLSDKVAFWRYILPGHTNTVTFKIPEAWIIGEDMYYKEPKPVESENKYVKTIRGKDIHDLVVYTKVDVYDVLSAWEVQNPALQHLIKKALQPGGRGYKSLVEDLKDIIVSAQRALEIEQSKGVL